MTLLQENSYKANVNLRIAMPLSMAATRLPLKNFPFSWSTDKFTYQGLQIPRDTFLLLYIT